MDRSRDDYLRDRGEIGSDRPDKLLAADCETEVIAGVNDCVGLRGERELVFAPLSNCRQV